MVVARDDPGNLFVGGGQLALPDVEQHQDRLLREEPEAADRLLLVLVELDVPDGPAGLQRFLQPDEDHLLTLVRLSLGGCTVSTARLQPIEPPIHERQVSNDEFEVQPLEVAGGVDRAIGMRVVRVLKGADDVEQGVRLAQPGEVLRR